MRFRIFGALIASMIGVGCYSTPQGNDPAPHQKLNRENVGAAWADHAMATAGTNRSGLLSREQWAAMGGTSPGFAALDTDASGSLSYEEIRKGASTDKFWATVQRTMDVSSNTPMTPRVFRNPASARLFTFEF